MPDLTFSCPECETMLRGKDSLIGKNVKCPKCQKIFVIPSPIDAIAPQVNQLYFNCPECDTRLKGTEEMVGKKVKCPKCQKSFTLQAIPNESSSQTSSPPIEQPKTKSCPYCGESILDVAMKCKYCGEMLDGSGRSSASRSGFEYTQANPPQDSEQTSSQARHKFRMIPKYDIDDADDAYDGGPSDDRREPTKGKFKTIHEDAQRHWFKIVVGIAIFSVVFGGIYFGIGFIKQTLRDKERAKNELAIIDDMKSIAAEAYNYRIRPSVMLGGNGSYSGFGISSRMQSNENASFSALVLDGDRVKLMATSNLGFGRITAEANAGGGLSNWDFSEFAGGVETSEASSVLGAPLTAQSTAPNLVGCDWVTPGVGNPVAAWKFLGDGTFSYSTTSIGGSSHWGTWMVIEPGKIWIEYTRSSGGELPPNQTATMSDANTLIVGSTTYIRQ